MVALRAVQKAALMVSFMVDLMVYPMADSMAVHLVALKAVLMVY